MRLPAGLSRALPREPLPTSGWRRVPLRHAERGTCIPVHPTLVAPRSLADANMLPVWYTARGRVWVHSGYGYKLRLHQLAPNRPRRRSTYAKHCVLRQVNPTDQTWPSGFLRCEGEPYTGATRMSRWPLPGPVFLSLMLVPT